MVFEFKEMRETLSARIKRARKRAGYSYRRLSDELDRLVSPGTLKQYEEGKKIPTTGVLLSMADALKVKLDYFSRPIRFELGDIEFRKKASIGKKQVEIIKETTLDLLERYVEAEQLANTRSAFHNPLENREIRSEESIEEAVKYLKTVWEIPAGPIPDVIQLLENKKIKVIEIDATEKFDGLSTYVQSFAVTLLNRNFPADRKRFTALHELGHLLLEISPEKDHENFCNRFAGAMLISRKELVDILGQRHTSVPPIEELISIKERYGISLQAIMRRAYDLGIVNKAIYQQFHRKIAHNKVEQGLGTYRGEEEAKGLVKILTQLLVDNKITIKKAANLAGMSLPDFQQLLERRKETLPDWSYNPAGTLFSEAFSEEEPDYNYSDLIEINPDYDPR